MNSTPQTSASQWTWETYDGDDRVFIHCGNSATGLETKPIILRGPDKITNVERAELIVRSVNLRAALVEALEETERIELLYANRSENIARVNSRQGTAESIMVSRARLKEIEIELRKIRNSTKAVLAAAKP